MLLTVVLCVCLLYVRFISAFIGDRHLFKTRRLLDILWYLWLGRLLRRSARRSEPILMNFLEPTQGAAAMLIVLAMLSIRDCRPNAHFNIALLLF